METILPYRSLVGIPVIECGEALLVGQETAPEIEWSYEKRDIVAYLGDRMLVRAGALARVREAAAWLSRHLPGARLRVVYAYRLPSVQERYFDRRFQDFRVRYPEISDAEIRELAHTQSASPDVAGHPTGGALDLTIVTDRGPLDMGTAIADFREESAEQIKTFCADLSAEQRVNRALLRSVMMRSGFAPYNGEWWHFSYGDREWAAYWGEPHAVYGQIEHAPA